MKCSYYTVLQFIPHVWLIYNTKFRGLLLYKFYNILNNVWLIKKDASKMQDIEINTGTSLKI